MQCRETIAACGLLTACLTIGCQQQVEWSDFDVDYPPAVCCEPPEPKYEFEPPVAEAPAEYPKRAAETLDDVAATP